MPSIALTSLSLFYRNSFSVLPFIVYLTLHLFILSSMTPHILSSLTLFYLPSCVSVKFDKTVVVTSVNNVKRQTSSMGYTSKIQGQDASIYYTSYFFTLSYLTLSSLAYTLTLHYTFLHVILYKYLILPYTCIPIAIPFGPYNPCLAIRVWRSGIS